jgi:hypothetical protein
MSLRFSSNTPSAEPSTAVACGVSFVNSPNRQEPGRRLSSTWSESAAQLAWHLRRLGCEALSVGTVDVHAKRDIAVSRPAHRLRLNSSASCSPETRSSAAIQCRASTALACPMQPRGPGTNMPTS